LGMTGVGESESPKVSEKESKIENAEGVRNDNSLSRDFASKKQSKSTRFFVVHKVVGNAHLKILVPSIAAGAIIGKCGEAITQIQNSTGAKVKMSKANDFYPDVITTSGVGGSTSQKIYYLHHSTPLHPLNFKHLVKILVPNSTAGMIIGKGGSFIKEIKDQTGAFIQVSQKSKEMSLAERCITVGGELSQTRETMRLLLMKIAEDPQSSSCPNISYMDVAGPVASAYPTGSPYAICVPPPHSISCSPPGRAAAFLHSHGAHFPGGGDATTGAAGGGFGGGFCPQPHQRGGTSTGGGGGGFHSHSPGAGGPIAFTMGPLPVASPKGGLSPGSAVYEPCGQLGSPTLGTDNAGRLIGQTLATRCGRNGVASSACLPGTSGCLTNRCSTAGAGASANHQSLLGAASNLWFSNPCSTTLCSPTRSIASLSGNATGPSAATVNQDAIRASLQGAGFTEDAAEEIAHAIQVLNVYGFLSSPGGSGGGGVPTPLQNNRTVAVATRCGSTGGDSSVNATGGGDSSSVNVFKTIVDGNAPPPQRYLSGTADVGSGESHCVIGPSQQRSSSASSPSLSRARSSQQQQSGLGLAALLGESVGLRASTASAGAGYPCASALPEEIMVTPAVRSSSSTGFYPSTASVHRPSSARPALTASQNDIAAMALVTTTTVSNNLRKGT
uniref:RNA-binding protein Nova-1 n=1 Tax=Schistocephalus solidus TaxID=70667 RepID=A0A183T771_SCHSO